MSLAAGTRVGPYEIRALLGAGGMGEVYRATDGALGRDVAIKFLPESVAGDPSRRSRFEREAQVLASLNHPNIAQVYGLHDSALVMELLDGAPLSAHLAEGPLPIRKAITYAVQIARGLAAAHDRGIVHRDLKPDNVFVLKDGHVKIIDFGLARAREPQTAAGDALTATAATVNTDPGTVLGTIGYMAPEQVRGEPVDARADLFALGVVLYEMLAGQRAFKRDTAVETMTAILREDPPDLIALRPEIPPAIERIVRHCLEKNPVERFQTARDVAFALDSLSASGSGISGSSVSAPAMAVEKSSRPGMVLMVLPIAIGLAGIALGFMFGRGQKGSDASAAAPGVAYRTLLPLPDGTSIPQELQGPLRLGVSPDGRRIAYVRPNAVGAYSIWEYAFDTGTSRFLTGTENGVAPIWSADGRSLAFNIGNQLKVRDEQGRVETIAGLSYGAAVESGEYVGLIGTPGRFNVAVVRKPGAAPEVLLKPASDVEDFVTPQPIRGTRLFVVQHRTASGARQVEIASLDGGAATVLVADGSTPSYAAGSLIFSRGDRLYAQPLDLDHRQLTGEPTLLAEHVDLSTATGTAYSVSDRVLAYTAVANSGLGRVTVMKRDGTMVKAIGAEDSYSNIELSPDGKRLAVSVTDTDVGRRDIVVFDLARGVRQRLTSDPSDERSAVWTRDGRNIIYNSRRLDLFMRPSDFGDGERALLEDQVSKDPRDVSPDGTQLLYRYSGAGTSNDLWVMSLTGEAKPHAVLATKANENYGSFSPDGKSIIYVSDESGRLEVFTMALSGGGKTQISTAGGTFPRWRQPNEIVYLAPDRTLMRVAVGPGGFGVPQPMFKIDYLEGPGTPFDITPDGQQIVVNAITPSKLPPSLNLIVNWTALLRPAQR